MNILWDFDGTIFDTYPTIVKAFKELLTDQTISEDDIL
ncbi:HAD hydrolase-like protein, partial [Priestia megaterium]